MSVSRKENGSLVKKAGRAVVDLALSLTSNHAVANSAVTEAITEINNDLTDLNQKVPTFKMFVFHNQSLSFNAGRTTFNSGVTDYSNILLFATPTIQNIALGSLTLESVDSDGTLHLICYNINGGGITATLNYDLLVIAY